MTALPDGRVVTSGSDQRVLVWDLSTPGREPTELGRHDDWVQAMTALPDGRVVTGGGDGWVLVWDPGRSQRRRYGARPPRRSCTRCDRAARWAGGVWGR